MPLPAPQKPIIVHHLENSRSLAIVWLLEELQLPYELRLYLRDRTSQLAPSELGQVHPLGKSPAIEIPVESGNGVLAESGAIIQYLSEVYGDGKLNGHVDAETRRRVVYWSHFAEGTMMSALVNQMWLSKAGASRSDQGKAITGLLKYRISQQTDYIEDILMTEGPYFAGAAFTLADVAMLYPLQSLTSSLPKDFYPNIRAWVKRLEDRSAYQAAEKKGGSLDFGAFRPKSKL